MGVIGKDFDYKKVENFLTKDEINLLAIYCELKHKINITQFDNTNNNNMDTRFYGDAIMDSLLLSKQPFMEKITGKKLLATYSFWRCYTKYSNLLKHKDRPPCEISVTVKISGDKEWPIYMNDTPVDLENGDAVIYLGNKLTHHREEFTGDYQFQTFLHYVDADGEFTDHFMDGRQYWGITWKKNEI